MVRFGGIAILALCLNSFPALARTFTVSDVSLSVLDLNPFDESEPVLTVHHNNASASAWVQSDSVSLWALSYLMIAGTNYIKEEQNGGTIFHPQPFSLLGSALLFAEAEVFFTVRGGVGQGELAGFASAEYDRWLSNVPGVQLLDSSIALPNSTDPQPITIPFQFNVPMRLFIRTMIHVPLPPGTFETDAYFEAVARGELSFREIRDLNGNIIPGAYFEEVTIPEPSTALLFGCGASVLFAVGRWRRRSRAHAACLEQQSGTSPDC